MKLTAIQAFGKYEKGESITDQGEIKAILAGEQAELGQAVAGPRPVQARRLDQGPADAAHAGRPQLLGREAEHGGGPVLMIALLLVAHRSARIRAGGRRTILNLHRPPPSSGRPGPCGADR